ncbi:MAG: hypothetical protein O0X93_01065 [Methanocorpusculum sp.]|nr:hypothetical protein [Methanocorpusculum sp.]MDE2521735.1 hypothetical protein [Methanocorpusculum sp.]
MFFGLVCGTICVQSRSFSVSCMDAAQYSPEHGTYIIQCILECYGRFDLPRFASAVRRVVQAVPLLSSRYVCENGVPVRWEPAEELPELVSVSFRPVLAEAAAPRRMEGRPPLHITVCRGDENDDLLVVMDHVAADARGMFVVLSLIADAYAGREIAVPDQPEERGIAKLFQNISAGELRTVAKRSQEPVVSLFPWASPFAKPCTVSPIRIVHKTISSGDFSRIHAAARSSGATIQDVLMAAFASALRTIGASVPVPLESAMDLRPALGPGAGGWIGNFSANYWLAISPANDMRETVSQAAVLGRTFKANHPAVACTLRFLDPAVRSRMDIRLPEDDPGLDLRCPFLSNVGVIPPSAGSFGRDVTVSAVWTVTDFVSGRYPSLVAGTWNGSLHLAAAVASGDMSADCIFDLMIGTLQQFTRRQAGLPEQDTFRLPMSR